MKPLLTVALLAGAVLPGLARGQCVGKVLLPPVEGSRQTRVLVSPARVERIYVPADVARDSRKILVRPSREERVSWTAVYRTERSWVQALGPIRWRREPDRYAQAAERVLVEPGRYVWERRGGPLVSGPPQPGQTMVTPTGVIMCRVWRPARYRTVLRRVRIGAGRRLAERSTSVRRQVTRRVLVRPAGTAVRHTAAEYRWVSSARVVAPGYWAIRRSPAQYAWRSEREVRDGGSTYAPVVCGGPLSRQAMARLQASLAVQGYDPGPVDGLGRPQTYTALHRFQVDHRLAAGQVTVESARALGVTP